MLLSINLLMFQLMAYSKKKPLLSRGNVYRRSILVLDSVVLISIRSAIAGNDLDLLGTRLSFRPVTQGVLSPLQCFTAEFGMDRRGSIATSAPRS